MFCLNNQSNPTKVSEGASSYCRGTVLLQKQESGVWKPVAYSSENFITKISSLVFSLFCFRAPVNKQTQTYSEFIPDHNGVWLGSHVTALNGVAMVSGMTAISATVPILIVTGKYNTICDSIM